MKKLFIKTVLFFLISLLSFSYAKTNDAENKEINRLYFEKLLESTNYTPKSYKETKSILLLHSYHNGIKWVDDMNKGIKALFPNDSNVQFTIEYMNTKRTYSKKYINMLKKIYKLRYENEKFDLIISTDNNALNFLLNNKDELFPNTPIAFNGANFFKKEQLRGATNISGVSEEASIKESIKIALKLHPKVKNVFIVNDYTASGLLVKEKFEEVAKEIKEINFIHPKRVTKDELFEQIKNLPADTIIFYHNFFRDKNGKFQLSKKIVDEVIKISDLPIYTAWKFNTLKDVVGGKIVTGFAQGVEVANIAHRILSGEKADNIPVVRDSGNIYTFQKRMLDQYNINIDSLPKNSIVLDKKNIFTISTVSLTNKEQKYLDEKKVLKVCLIPSFMPYEGIDEKGNHIGVTRDLMKKSQEVLNLKFEIFRTNNFEESLKAIKERKCDFMPLIKETEHLKSFLNFTKPYLTLETGLATRSNEVFIEALDQVLDKKIGVTKDTAYENYIKENYPNINLLTFNNTKEALNAIREKKIFGYVNSIGVIGFAIQKNADFSIKIAGKLDFPFGLSIATRNDETNLHSIFQKVVKSIKQEDIAKAHNKWIEVKLEQKIDYSLIYKILTIAISIILLILFWLKKSNDEIKKRKIIEEELEDSNDELEQTITNIKQLQKKLIESEKMASLGSLVAGVAHEINTPVGIGLTASSHFTFISEILKEKYDKEEMTEKEFENYLEESKELSVLIFSNLNRTSDIIKNFKQVAIDQSSEQKREFNVKEYTKGILLSIDNIIKNKDIKIDINCDEDLNINSYPGLFTQILTNLIINSMRHGFKLKEAGNIIIGISIKNELLTLVYKDNGVGITKKNLPQIFNPFFTTNREDGGSGLGLNILYNIINNSLNGTIICNSEENSGVEFIIKINVGAI